MTPTPLSVTPPPTTDRHPVRVICTVCSAATRQPNPAGWVVVGQPAAVGAGPRFGICPACLTAEYEFTVPDGDRVG